MSRVHELSKRFPYMFSGRNAGFSVADGWVEVFTKLCEDIDAVLGENKRGFHWVQLKEKFGSARFYHQHDGGTDEVFWLVDDLVDKAQEKTESMCFYCGKPGKADAHRGWMLVVCEEHAAERKGKAQ